MMTGFVMQSAQVLAQTAAVSDDGVAMLLRRPEPRCRHGRSGEWPTKKEPLAATRALESRSLTKRAEK